MDFIFSIEMSINWSGKLLDCPILIKRILNRTNVRFTTYKKNEIKSTQVYIAVHINWFIKILLRSLNFQILQYLTKRYF